MNVIDILAITPFFVEAALAGLEIPGLAVFRVVRLVRVFRLFKVSRGSIAVFSITLHRSAKPLYMLIFFTSIAMVLSSSLMYYAERGKYDEARGAWTRLSHYECRITVRTSAPTTVDANHSIASGNPDVPCRFDSQGDSEYEAYFICPYTFMRTDECDKIYEVSPFSSIPGTFWWCLVTMTTVGYGDVYPTQWVGKLVGMIVFMMGILVIALPITLIGSNFSNVYQKLVLDAEAPAKDEDGIEDVKTPESQQKVEK
ncbi:hypothetical protein CYMTET_20846 [Cymbomonas tetramitiformis]|uniref:Ion transport domain-containing protein n=1 Tax=Cymbomonas tetramitiformis TaxID=36881 RepID=A0AAE0L3T4_9CHLO|nr:hypothetical protein CYMTET_20846 [Cymbomonas tetramitiformis]